MLPRQARTVLHLEIAPRLDEEAATHQGFERRYARAMLMARIATLSVGVAVFLIWFSHPAFARIALMATSASGLAALWLIISTSYHQSRHICFDHRAYWDMRTQMLR